MASTLLILNDPPYGTERSYNALRLAREYRDAPMWAAGYSNDVFGYLASERVLREGGYDANGMVAILGRLQQAGRLYENGAPDYLRSHPVTSTRISDLPCGAAARRCAGRKSPCPGAGEPCAPAHPAAGPNRTA